MNSGPVPCSPNRARAADYLSVIPFFPDTAEIRPEKVDQVFPVKIQISCRLVSPERHWAALLDESR